MVAPEGPITKSSCWWPGQCRGNQSKTAFQISTQEFSRQAYVSLQLTSFPCSSCHSPALSGISQREASAHFSPSFTFTRTKSYFISPDSFQTAPPSPSPASLSLSWFKFVTLLGVVKKKKACYLIAHLWWCPTLFTLFDAGGILFLTLTIPQLNHFNVVLPLSSGPHGSHHLVHVSQR